MRLRAEEASCPGISELVSGSSWGREGQDRTMAIRGDVWEQALTRRTSLLLDYHRGDVLAVACVGVVIGFGVGLLAVSWVAPSLLRLETTSNFLLRAARRVRMLATTASRLGLDSINTTDLLTL